VEGLSDSARQHYAGETTDPEITRVDVTILTDKELEDIIAATRLAIAKLDRGNIGFSG
jgi:hypothetical protein